MQLKRYQERVVREVRTFLRELEKYQAAGSRYASLEAWDESKKNFFIPGDYKSRRNGLDRDLPTFCVRVPTGGGKTLLAAQVLGEIYGTILKSENGAGLVLWVVPSDQIYKDTLKGLRDRNNFLRESLEFAVSRRVEVWEKDEIARITPSQLNEGLNILLLKLASTNRESREQLKFFRDSGGNIMQHFPPEDRPEEHKALKERIPNLDMLAEDEATGEYLAATSVANLVRLCEPPVILDEGHKATSDLARKTIEGFNPRIVVELSATPKKEANILTRVTGRELLDEEMIKLPINVSNSNERSWKDCLTQAKDKREELAGLAAEHYKFTGRLIRPIVLVQVERTGKDQRNAEYVHSEDVREHLVQRLGVPEAAVAVKTSEKDEIENINLLAEGCPVEWIVTKSALQEGWDCPFAYVLVSLNNTGSQLSMTQLVGRVLRQPYVERTAYEGLNESYVFCLRKGALTITKEVKKALEQEGYEGDAMSVADRSGEGGLPKEKLEARMRSQFRRYYRQFEGKVYLPRFCVKSGKDYEPLDYYRHLISMVDVSALRYEEEINWDLGEAIGKAKDSYYRIELEQPDIELVRDGLASLLETDEHVRSWLAASLAFDHFSYKETRTIVSKVLDRLYELDPALKGQLASIKFELRDRISGFVLRETDRRTHEAFDRLFETGRLCFYLECVEGRFEIPPVVELKSTTRRLVHENGEQVQQSLFDYVPDSFNDYERAVALYLDRSPQVLWWYRNLVGHDQFAVQGYKRQKIYPDFVIQEGRTNGKDRKPIASVLVLESKGKHLKGSPDTNYKRSIADYFGKVGHEVSWQKLAEDFRDNRFRFQILDEGDYPDRDWRDELKKVLEDSDFVSV